MMGMGVCKKRSLKQIKKIKKYQKAKKIRLGKQEDWGRRGEADLRLNRSNLNMKAWRERRKGGGRQNGSSRSIKPTSSAGRCTTSRGKHTHRISAPKWNLQTEVTSSVLKNCPILNICISQKISMPTWHIKVSLVWKFKIQISMSTYMKPDKKSDTFFADKNKWLCSEWSRDKGGTQITRRMQQHQCYKISGRYILERKMSKISMIYISKF